MSKYGTCLNDRARYRKDLHRAAAQGARAFERFLTRHSYLFALEEWGRVLRSLDAHGANLARLTDHKFRSFRGEPHDPKIDGNNYPTIIEVIITPHLFMRHALSLTGAR